MEEMELGTQELIAQAGIVRALVESDLGRHAVDIDEAYRELRDEFGLDERAIRSGIWDVTSYYPSQDGRTIPRLEPEVAA